MIFYIISVQRTVSAKQVDRKLQVRDVKEMEEEYYNFPIRLFVKLVQIGRKYVSILMCLVKASVNSS